MGGNGGGEICEEEKEQARIVSLELKLFGSYVVARDEVQES